MFASSISRVVRSGPSHSLSSSFTAWASTNSVAASAVPTLCRRHQRRQSSSKTSNSPDGGSRNLGAPADPSSKDAAPATKLNNEKNTTTRLGRRRSRDVAVETVGKAKDETALNIPSVPSTQHLHPHGNGKVAINLTGAPMLTSIQTSKLPPSSPFTAPYPLLPPCPLIRHQRRSLVSLQHVQSQDRNLRMSSTPCRPPSICSSQPKVANNPHRRPNRQRKRWSCERQSLKRPSVTQSLGRSI